MVSDTFLDSSGFFALLVTRDRMHERSADLIARAAKSRRRFVTTDYVLGETATLLKARGKGHLCTTCFDLVFGASACRVEWMDPDRFAETRRFFLKRHDQDWSFTDCFSFWIMQEFRLRDALSTDVHFRQAGFNPLLI